MHDHHVLIDFSLADQFGRVHARDDYRGEVVVMVGSDRSGNRYVPAWLEAVRDGVAGEPGWERIRTLGVADVRGVPGFLRPVIAAAIPRTPTAGVLLDWDGLFARAYDFVPGECNVLVADRDGRVVFRTSGREVERVRAGLLVQHLRALLRGDVPPPA